MMATARAAAMTTDTVILTPVDIWNVANPYGPLLR